MGASRYTRLMKAGEPMKARNEKIMRVAARLHKPEGQCARYVIVRWALDPSLKFYYNEDHFAYGDLFITICDVVTGLPIRERAGYDKPRAMRVAMQFRDVLDVDEVELLYQALGGVAGEV